MFLRLRLEVVIMGFLSELLKDVFNDTVEKAEKLCIEKYNQMPIEQLKQEWNEKFAHRSASEGLGYSEHSTNAVLDEVYGRRVSYRNWRWTVENYQRQNKR